MLRNLSRGARFEGCSLLVKPTNGLFPRWIRSWHGLHGLTALAEARTPGWISGRNL